MLNIQIAKGENLSFAFPALTDDEGNPYDVTGWHAKLQVRKVENVEPADITLKQDDGLTEGGTNGIFTAAFLPSHTSSLDVGRYLYDIYTKDDTNGVKKRFEGYFTIQTGITRDIS